MRFPGTDDEFCSEKNKQISITFTVVKKCDLWGCQITRNDVNTQAIEKYWKKKGNLGEHFGLDITFGCVPCLADFITIAL